MSPADAITQLRANGRTVTLTDEGRISIRPGVDPTTLASITAHRAAIVDALEAERWCYRCRRRHDRTTPAYWSTSERYCPGCCSVIAADMDRRQTWPTPPWTLDDLATLNALESTT